MISALSRAAALAAALFLAACNFPPANPLLGHWVIETPDGALTLGSCDFSEHHMTAFGLDIDVDYQVAGDMVRVLPRQVGPELQVTMRDRDNAQVATPLLGNLVILRRTR